ncbi:peptide chain release factor N(5)-glutamine methyltransferase [Burkholderiaceae bacterium FT117]|uniref:peptide chain release factor N(5)-glutamine methyltransferase n=1 Tax=Zeimonas sediminis TaxID=2944268 RepID=UPI002342E05E|nr:peptide chain release factor N(5)-glutamine methyltransferase [Zeimonas sediminis]MCM5571845.1 peptide chain release factor N(5)-glutamine methyltransferase [Zeimonas sediminis]
MLAASGLPRLEARALLEHACGRGRSWLIAHGEEAAPPDAAARFATLAQRRRAGEPLAYLTGFREFHGLRLRVSPAVLIPRADTELLVELAIRLAPPGARLLDLGTGSGAIAVAVAAARPDLRVSASDLSEAALAIAAANEAAVLPAGRAGGAIRWMAGNWWAALPADEPRFELIVSNPPYIAAGDPHLARGDLPHEPAQALASGPDGLDALREIAAGASARLLPGGWLLVEHGFDQGAAVRALFEAAGLREVATHRDAEGRERVTAGRRPGG